MNATISKLKEIAKRLTAGAKAAKAYTLDAASKRMQALEMPEGYLWATIAEVNAILEANGLDMIIYRKYETDERKHIWALNCSPVAYSPRKKNRIWLTMAI